MDRVRDAMVIDPPQLDGSATAQEAGEALDRPEVRAVFVSDQGRFLGVVTRKTLVREIVAAGRDPRTTALREVVEVPRRPAHPERIEDGRLVGVLSRAVLQRRLAEDEPPPEDES